ncbi:hypothetical protein [Pseudomonas sp. RL_5y_Pfl2_73]|uniref:hypothetical protein n=1 Tax=unclassified Pseudomonas TaxID=196821 RepID=UPI00403F3697
MNNLLSASNSARYGYRTVCIAGIGQLLEFAGLIDHACDDVNPESHKHLLMLKS